MDKINTKGIKTTRKMRPKKRVQNNSQKSQRTTCDIKNSNGKREKQGEQS